ncbi:HlyD family secretion protein [Chachezhania sediminis]|uniref:HlyD family secretion protein n=1 Tax=Chachezhania sediminis TaxID=2599291 RepID=UPI00131D39B2|nr:HlyD family secretion protein [Chachezhania sediminis]
MSDTATAPDQPHRGTPWIARIVVLLALVGLIAGGYWYIRYSDTHPSTRDAYVGANIVHVSAQVAGQVTRVPNASNTAVKAGDVLVQLDASEFEAEETLQAAQVSLAQQEVASAIAAVDAARAEIAAQQAILTNAEAQYKRIADLVAKGDQTVSKSDDITSTLNQAKAEVEAAKARLTEAQAKVGGTETDNARVQVAQANLTEAKLNLSHAVVHAPADGTLGPVTLRPGDYVQAGESLFPLVEDDTWYITANFKETDLTRIRPGMTAHVTIDMYPGQSWTGTVESLSPASGAAFALLPPENATGNWVKVTQRFPVRIAMTNDRAEAPLRVGASATVKIDTEQAAAPAAKN